MYSIGIDTSGYTTSLAVINLKGELVIDERVLLQVKTGEKGLRQSKAVFQHMQNIPLLMSIVEEKIQGKNVVCFSASIKPRPLEKSYMPVFKVGESFSRSFSRLIGTPFFPTTHQEGHIWSVLFSLDELPKNFLALHISGGTTELIKVHREGLTMSVEPIGGSSDLPLGQFIDRIGVKLGLPFPCGPYLENLALKSRNPIPVPVSVKGCHTSYSGPLSHVERLLDSIEEPADLARGVEICAASSLAAVLNQGVKDTGIKVVIIAGGVSSNRFIRQQLEDSISDVRLIFASPDLSSDNAVGVSYYGLKKWEKLNKL